MRRALGLLAIAILTLPALDGTGLPGDTRWLVQLDVRRVLDGGLGPWLREQAAAPGTRARVALLRNATGIDLLTDVDRITLAGPDTRDTEAVFIAVGRFDRAKLEIAAEAGAGHRTEALRSHVLHRMFDAQRNRDTWATLAVGEKVLIAGASRQRVAAVLDALDGAAPPVDLAPFAVGGAALDAPLVAAAAGLDRWVGTAPEAELLRNVTGITMTVREAERDLVLGSTLGAIDAATGADLASIVDGFLSLSRLSQETRRDPAWFALIKSAKLTRDGANLALTARTSLLDFQRSAEAHIAAGLAREASGK